MLAGGTAGYEAGGWPGAIAGAAVGRGFKIANNRSVASRTSCGSDPPQVAIGAGHATSVAASDQCCLGSSTTGASGATKGPLVHLRSA